MNGNPRGLSLPPKVDGNTRASLELRIEELSFLRIKSKKVPAKVFVRWWGQSLNEGVYFTPKIVQSLSAHRNSLPSNKGVRVAVYKVVSGRKRFSEYLQDAERLFLEVHCLDENEHTQILGYAILENLQRLIDNKCISDDLDIFDENGHLIGCLRLKMFYDPMNPTLESCDSSRADEESDVPVREAVVLRSKPKQNWRAPYVPQPLDSTLPKARVTFSGVDSPVQLTETKRTDLYEPEQTVGAGYRKYHSERQLPAQEVEALEEDTETEVYQNFTEEPQTREAEKEVDDSGDNLMNSTFDVNEDVEVKERSFSNLLVSDAQDFLRRWKLRPEMLTKLLNTDQIVTHIRKIRFSEQFLTNFLTLDFSQNCNRRSLSKQACTTEVSKMSFFVKFSIPPGGIENSCCSLKRDQKRNQHRKTKLGDIFFNHKSSQPINFEDQTVVGSWLTQNLSLKIYSRHLNQRVPTYVGESTFALKHLILHKHHGEGHIQQLPIFASKSVLRQLPEKTPEIIGDLTMDFFLTGSAKLKICESSGKEEPVIPKTYPKRVSAVIPTISDHHAPLSSIETHTNNFLPKRQAILEKPGGSSNKIILQTILQITEGKDFHLQDRTIQNVFVSCRFLGTGDLLTSQICWNIINPNFNFRHSIPVRVNSDFLEKCCKSNVLILEVWSFSQPKNKLIGIATIPLHQIYVSYKDAQRMSLVMNLKMPVVATDNWIEVQDVVSGEKVASIRALFAIGREVQISYLLRNHQKDMDSCSAPERVILTSKKVTTENAAQTVPSDPGTEQTVFQEIPSEKYQNLKQTDLKRKLNSEESCQQKSFKSTQTQNNYEIPCTCKSISLEEHPSENGPYVCLRVGITEGRNLPRIKSRLHNSKLPPNSYVTLPNVDPSLKARLPVSAVIEESCCPQWNFVHDLLVPNDFFQESRQHLILKIWHCDVTKNDLPTSDKFQDLVPDFERDPIIGFVAVDLNPLTLLNGRFEKLLGWYNIMDFVGRCRGQVHVNVVPVNARWFDRELLTREDSSSDEDTCPSHSKSNSNENSTPYRDLSKVGNDTLDEEEDLDVYVDDEFATKSFLASKISDLTDLAEKLRLKLDGKFIADNPGYSHLESRQNLMSDSEQNSVLGQSYTKNRDRPSSSFHSSINLTSQQVIDPRIPVNFKPIIIQESIQSSSGIVGKIDLHPIEELRETLVDVEVHENDKERDLLTFSVSPASIPELEDIQWEEPTSHIEEENRVTKSTKQPSKRALHFDPFEEDRSRMGPEGGNPTEEKN